MVVSTHVSTLGRRSLAAKERLRGKVRLPGTSRGKHGADVGGRVEHKRVGDQKRMLHVIELVLSQFAPFLNRFADHHSVDFLAPKINVFIAFHIITPILAFNLKVAAIAVSAGVMLLSMPGKVVLIRRFS